MIGRLHCWLVRLIGGEYHWKRATAMVSGKEGLYPSKTRECRRCGHVVPVVSRNKVGGLL